MLSGSSCVRLLRALRTTLSGTGVVDPFQSWRFRPIRYSRAGGAQHPEAPVEGAGRGQWPGEEARKAEAEKGCSEQGAAGRGRQGLFVGLQRIAALLEGRAADAQNGGRSARTAPYDTPSDVAVRGLYRAVRTHPGMRGRPGEEDFAGVREVFFEQLFHLGGEAGVLGHEVYLPVGDEACDVQVRRSHLRPPAVCDEGLGVDHRPPVLEDPDPRLQELPVART